MGKQRKKNGPNGAGASGRHLNSKKNRGTATRPAVHHCEDALVQNLPLEGAMVCERAQRCGACSCVNVPYTEQLEAKDAALRELFGQLLPACELDGALQPICGMSDPFHFRNKVISPFAPGRKGEILTGMYSSGTHRLVDTAGCVVENERANAVVQAIRSIMKRHGMEPYNEDTGKGFVRHVVVRVAHKTGEMLVTVVTNGEVFESSRGFCRELVRRCPGVTTVIQNVNTRSTNVVLGSEERTLYGPGFILDELCGLSFRISSRSFYQVNAMQTEVLYKTAVRMVQLTGTETVIDAYCGTGTIGLVAASGSGDVEAGKAAHVIGVESVESAVRDAWQNARHNGVGNAEFVCADATEFMRDLAAGRNEEAGKTALVGDGPLVLMMDPPRAGSTPEFLKAAAALMPERIVYISCNAKTQVRDMAVLMNSGYVVSRIQPVDMFPHTEHVETVALLHRL